MLSSRDVAGSPAIVVMQTDLSTTANSGRDRLVGTAIGGLMGWPAGRFGAVTISVIVLTTRPESLWFVALSRFLEVSWGILVAIGAQSLLSFMQRRWQAGGVPRDPA